MNIKLELISKTVSELIAQQLNFLDVDIDKIANTTAILALSEIQEVIKNEDISDFDAIEQIVCIFEKYKISAGTRHDFG